MENGDIARDSRPLVIAMAVVALLIALYSVVSQLSGPAVYRPGDSDISVSAGDRFTIAVPDDPDDGYHWIIAAPRPDPAVLEATGEHTDPDAEPGHPASGAGGTRELGFRAVRAGRTDLRLLHCRRCATGAVDEPGARTVNFRVTVD
ncbi:protease inhibitor I42 family protein [Streptomyces sp. YGL11-2]|uniref:protease inhibitor I42 family protein n=1 Tax=Streptomyces sp. YGL11-2 TaxID=3414028 RepID=UPI003CEC8378